LKRAAKLLQSYKCNEENLKKQSRSKTTPTNYSSDRKLDHANGEDARSRKRQVYIVDEDSASDISSECDDDSENDTEPLVEVCHLSKESIRKAIPSKWNADTGT
jgi:hypothetical protein